MKFYVSEPPRTVPRTVVFDLCTQLGLDANRVESIHLEANHVTARIVGMSEGGVLDPSVFMELTYRITDTREDEVG